MRACPLSLGSRSYAATRSFRSLRQTLRKYNTCAQRGSCVTRMGKCAWWWRNVFVPITYFLKPFFKGKIFAVEWERGKFDFDHYFAILTNFLRRCNFSLSGIWLSSSRGSFSKKNCPKRTFPSNFVKLVSKILYLFLAEKMVVCCCCCLLLQFFVPFWLTFF